RWIWSIDSPEDTGGVAGSSSNGRGRGRNGWCLPFGDLPVEVDEVAREKTCDLGRPRGHVWQGAGGDQLGVARHGELALETEERTLGSEVGLLLFQGGRAREAVGDVGAD